MLENTNSEGVINETVEPQLTVVVNGVEYISIAKPKRKPKKNVEDMSSMEQMIMQMYQMFGAPGLGSLMYGKEKYVRKLPEHVDVVEEYGKVQLKQSKLCRWDRDEVVRLFKANYKLA